MSFGVLIQLGYSKEWTRPVELVGPKRERESGDGGGERERERERARERGGWGMRAALRGVRPAAAARRWLAGPGRAPGLSRPLCSSGAGQAEEHLCEMAEALADSPELAKSLVARMDPGALREVTRAWATLQAEPAQPPQPWQLRRLALLSGLPMIGFGFMVSTPRPRVVVELYTRCSNGKPLFSQDNFIMLLAGDFIDATLCCTFSLSTMFAAGVGNIFSDVVGLAAAGPIELLLKRLGISGHHLSPAHLQMWSVVTCKYAGSAIGMVIGCLMGMCPLLFPEKYRLWESRAQLERSAGATSSVG